MSEKACDSSCGVVGVVGWHNSGKTTLVEQLVRYGKERGYRVAVLKHTRGTIDLDRPGSDTSRLMVAGADSVAIAGPEGMATWQNWQIEPALEHLLERLTAGVDLLIVEGYKHAEIPRIEVRRAAVGGERVVTDSELLALVTDEGVPAACPVYRSEQVDKVWCEIERKVLRREWRNPIDRPFA